jgi:hypothetical protein
MNESVAGKPWTDDEIEAALGSYFRMLLWEREGRGFVKAEVRQELSPRLPGRSKRAIELKWCNVSAVLEEMGLPWVTGYKPLRHYQRRLAEVVESWLDRNPEAHRRLRARGG